MGSRLSLTVGGAVAALALSGCEQGGLFAPSGPEAGATAAADRPAATRLMERDVEAPDVFQRTEAGLWDGRPSLGGVWVAHPEVEDPERVLIRNNANGETVIGALFRRERDRPGPRFQVSSDAAEALAMLAGAPVELDVTALRREQAPAEAPKATEPAPDATATDTPGGEAPETATSETTAPETEAPRAAAPEPDPSGPGGQDETAAASAAAAIDRAEAAGTEGGTAGTPAARQQAGAAEPERRGLLARLFRRGPGEPLSAISGPAAAGAATAAGTAGSTAGTTPAVTAEPLAPRPAAARGGAEEDALRRPYVQVATFRGEAGAQRAAETLRSNGVVPAVRPGESGEATVYRVVAGPAGSSADRAALMEKVKDLGFDDAYAVSR